MKEIKPIARFNRQQKTNHNLFSSFGPYRAGMTLDDVLNEIGDCHFSARIGSLYSKNCQALNELDMIISYVIRLRMIDLLLKDVRQTITAHSKQSIGKKQFAWNLLNNVVNSHFKDRIRELLQERHELWLEETAEQRQKESEAAKLRNKLQQKSAPESSSEHY